MWDMANFIANSIKENGLVLPVNFTEEEFFEAGRCLAKIEQGMQWAIGDWYNSIPWGDKESACKEVGLSYETAHKYGNVCATIVIRDRIPNLGFAHHQILAIQDLTDNQRTDLLEKASKNPEAWTVARLRHERDILLGKPEKVATLEFDEEVDRLLSDLPASISKKAKQGIKQVYGKMKTEFQIAVEKEVNKRLAVERGKLLEIRKEVQNELHLAKEMAQGITPLMTQEEFNLIRGLLHPDRHPDQADRYNRAFEIFMRLEQGINPNIPSAVLRKRGWSR